ncbi:hypothetical protein HDU90_008525 [Geranomyces variabilis]|nr:hypothetical protein HDU90_008525 [Geranomyces variabilis]
MFRKESKPSQPSTASVCQLPTADALCRDLAALDNALAAPTPTSLSLTITREALETDPEAFASSLLALQMELNHAPADMERARTQAEDALRKVDEILQSAQ